MTTEKAEKKVEVTKDMEKIITQIETMSVLDLSNLVKALEEKFGVTAAVPIAAAAPAAGGAGAVAAEKDSFNVVLVSFGDNKIGVIKEVRTLTGLGLKEAKDIVDNLPKPIKEGCGKEEAEKMKAALAAAGATVELK